MKAHAIFAVVAMATLCFAASPVSASEKPNAPSITLLPTSVGFDSMMPDQSRVREITQEKLTGMVAVLEVYVDRLDAKGHPALDRNSQAMYIFATESGRYVMRFAEPWFGYVEPAPAN